MKINNTEIDFKASRLRDAEALEVALQNMEQREVEVKALAEKKDVKLTEIIRGTLGLIQGFFIEATGMDVLEGCEEIEEATKIYQQFLTEIEKQKIETILPYSPDRIK